MLTESRQDAVGRLVEMAEAAGADAVLGLRFDCSEITQSLSEVAAYGTAVKLGRSRRPPTRSATRSPPDADGGPRRSTQRSGQAVHGSRRSRRARRDSLAVAAATSSANGRQQS